MLHYRLNLQCYDLIQTGARLVIHNPQQWPLIDEFGIDISPATYTLAAITEVILFYLYL